MAYDRNERSSISSEAQVWHPPNRFGALHVRAIEIIKEEEMTALKKFLSTAFSDTWNQLSELEPMDQLEKFPLDHT